MVSILLAGELGDELHDPAVDRLQRQDLRSRWLPGGKGHPYEEVPYRPGIDRVGLGSLHASAREILDRTRVDHHHLHPFRVVQGEGELQTVNPGRFQADPRRVAALGYPANELLVPGRRVRKRRDRSPLLCALHGTYQLLRINIHSNLIDLLHGGSRTTLNSGSPDLASLRNRPCDADSRVWDTPRYWQRRRGADLTNKIQALRHQRPPRRNHSFHPT